MHIIHTLEPLPLVRGAKEPNPSGRYLVDNNNAGEYMSMWPHAMLINHRELTPFDPDRDWNDSRVCLIRPGGLGDLMFLTPVCAELKRRWPRIHITICTVEFNAPVLEHNPDIDAVIPYPLPESEMTFDCMIPFEEVLETGPHGKEWHAVDVFADVLGLKVTDRQVRLYLTDEEKERMAARCPYTGKKRVGIQLRASALARSYPRTLEVARLLAEKGREVYIFNAPGCERIQSNMANIVDVAYLDPSPSFRESCALLLTCDVLVAPDSSLTHAAGALGVPCIALYGPFPWQLRTAGVETTRALQGSAPCAPCFHHQRNLQAWPKNGPCFRSGKCEALDSIEPRRVVAKVEALL